MLYHLHEMQHMAMMPARMFAEMLSNSLKNPWNPMAHLGFARSIGSAAEVFHQMTERYGRPAWGIEQVEIDGKTVPVEIETLIRRTYCHLVHFRAGEKRKDPRLLIVAPLSGHFATLLRGTVEGLLPYHDVYITDWQDCRHIPTSTDRFNLNDYIDYVIDFLHFLGPNTHLLAVCQPSVPSLAAASVMSAWGDLCAPASMTLIGGPIDTRENPTAVNKLALEHPIEWFESNVITTVPPPYVGAGRKVYPGFIQLTNFISMNLEKHRESMNQLFEHLVRGDEEEAEKRSAFYREYLAVMDLPAEYYLQTIQTVFQEHHLPEGRMTSRGRRIDPSLIRHTALMTIEGEKDDITGLGQTEAAHRLCSSLPDSMRVHHVAPKVGHYGVFNGRRWREEIYPHVREFIRTHDKLTVLADEAAERHEQERVGKPVRRMRQVLPA